MTLQREKTDRLDNDTEITGLEHLITGLEHLREDYSHIIKVEADEPWSDPTESNDDNGNSGNHG